MIVSNGKYYLYRHIRADKNEPFYIGIGTKRDAVTPELAYQRAHSKHGRNKIWHFIRKANGFVVEILLESDDYDFIIRKESEFISMYGLKYNGTGCLANISEFGNGQTGVVWSKERRDAHSKRNFGRKHSEETKRKMGDAQKRSYLFNRKKRSPITEETRKKLSAAKIGRSNTLGRKLTDEHKAKISAGVPKKLTKEDIKTAIELRRNGASYRQLSAMFNVSKTAIQNHYNNQPK